MKQRSDMYRPRTPSQLAWRQYCDKYLYHAQSSTSDDFYNIEMLGTFVCVRMDRNTIRWAFKDRDTRDAFVRAFAHLGAIEGSWA